MHAVYLLTYLLKCNIAYIGDLLGVGNCNAISPRLDPAVDNDGFADDERHCPIWLAVVRLLGTAELCITRQSFFRWFRSVQLRNSITQTCTQIDSSLDINTTTDVKSVGVKYSVDIFLQACSGFTFC